MSDSTKQTYMRGAAILAATAIISKIISALYRIPLMSMLDDSTAGYYQIAYNIYNLLIAISTAGIPIALSRLVSSASAAGNKRLVNRYFSVSLPAFALIGLVLMVFVFLKAEWLAALLNRPEAETAIRVLAPAVLFGCIIAVYRGYTQGHNNMLPTAVSQLLEVTCKAVFGLLIAGYLITNSIASTAVAAGAIAGVPIGLLIGIPVMVYFKRKNDRRNPIPAHMDTQDTMGRRAALAQVFKVGIPITLGSAFISLITNIDTSIVNDRLVSGAGFSTEAAAALYGLYSKGLTLLNLPSALVVPIAVSIVPIISAAITKKQYREARDVTESSLKLVNILALPVGIGISVISYPIYAVFFPGDTPGATAIGGSILMLFGFSSYFICMQLITTAFLQAYGHERVPIISFAIGGFLQIVIDYILVGNPDINIMGSPVGTLSCYMTIALVNLLFLLFKVKSKPNLAKIFIKPVLCTAVMGVAAKAVYELLYKVGLSTLGDGRGAMAVYMAAAIIIAAIVYVILIVATKTITLDDMRHIPKGDKIAKFLKIK